MDLNNNHIIKLDNNEISENITLTQNIIDEYKIYLDKSGRQNYYKHNYYGQNVTIAVIDSGVNEVDEIKDRVIEQYNFCDVYKEDELEDYNGHGTFVGTQVAGTNVGIAPQANIISLKVAEPLEGWIKITDVFKSLQWVIDNHEKVDIVNMSLSGSGGGALMLPMYENLINQIVALDIPIIVASGNTGEESITYPANFWEVICVGAVDYAKKHAMFSTQSDFVDVCQFGVGVLATDHRGNYVRKSGTSMATPLVAGCMALMICRKKTLGLPIIEKKLYQELKFENTIDVDDVGIDKRTGAGFVQLVETGDEINTHWADRYFKFLNNQNIKIHEKRYSDNATRGDFFALVSRYLGFKEEDNMSNGVHWAEKYWKYLNDNDVKIHEKRYDDKITRGEIFSVLAKLKGFKE